MAIISGTTGDDNLFTLGSNDRLLGFEGDDILDASPGLGNNELQGSIGNDELFAGTNDRLFGGEGDDILDASVGSGNNLLDGGEGNDTIFASSNDRVFGGSGNDSIFAGSGSNTLTGGPGSDRFEIAELPTTPNTITDFRPDTDVVSVSIVDSFSDVTVTQSGNNTILSAQGTEIAVLLNTQAGSLNANNLGGDTQTLESAGTVRFAQFNASLNRNFEGELVANLSTPDNQQAKNVAETIQINRPDVLVINEFDFVADGSAARLFQDNYLSIAQNNANAIDYPYFYIASSNTGIASGFDLNNNGAIVNTPGAAGYGDDAFGFGNFPGQFAFVIYSKYPIITEEIRTFQNFLWKDLPGNLLTTDPTVDNPATTINENLNGFYSPEEIAVLRLSSKNHVDVPVNINGKIVNVLVSHPTPPVFDGTEDRNGKRNSDEIRFFSDYINGADYIVDDKGGKGGLAKGSSFVLLGDQNSDPLDGDSRVGAIQQLLTNPNVNSNPSSVFPSSLGGVQQSDDGGININQRSNPAFDTADFSDNLTGAGNLRADYVLPSQDLTVQNAGVFIPLRDDPLFRLVGERGSFSTFQTAANTPTTDHSLVFIDVTVNAEKPANPKVTDLDFLGQATFPGASVDVLGTKLGGLSGITYDAANNLYYAISDDSGRAPEPGQSPRFYTLNIDLSSGLLPSNGVTFTGVTTLKRADGSLYPALSTDTEAIALTKNGTVFITSEGEAAANGTRVNPFVNEYNVVSGQLVRSLVVPFKFQPPALNLFGLSADGTQLLRFNNPNSTSITSTSTITGVVAGETLVGIDIRPFNGQLYGLGVNATANTGTLYLIDPRNGSAAIATGAAGQIAFVDTTGTPLDLPTGAYGIDFNPTVDRLRVVTSTGLNFRINPLTGGVVDGDAVAAGNNPDAGINGNGVTGLSATAYTNSSNGTAATTQYGLDAATNTLYIQNPPNSGAQTQPIAITLGGAALDFTEVAGFDIPANVQVLTSNTAAVGQGFASLTVGTATNLYAIELSTGVATLVSPVSTPLAGLAVGSAVETSLSLFGLSGDGSQLLRFNNPANPLSRNVVPTAITGITAGETLVGIDVRPLNGVLYGLGVNATANTGTLYTINTQTGAATIAVGTAGQIAFVDAAGTPLDLPTGAYGIDFNPTVDRLRVVTSTGLNFRLNPLTGGVVDGDAVAAGNNPDGAINGLATGLSATAYTNDFSGTTVTTQYTLDATTNSLFIQNPPNSGTQTSPLVVTLGGVALDFTEVVGFDIPSTVRVATSNTGAIGQGFAVLAVNGTTSLYGIELSTGAATLVSPVSTPVSGLTFATVAESTPTTGVRNNLGFESATITPNQKFLFTATENALVQDGSLATATSSSNVRILKYNLVTGNPEQEYLYVADAVEVAPNPSSNFSTSGLVDLLALSDNTFLAVERSFTVGAPGTGNTIKIYEVTIDGATDINSIPSLTNLPTAIAGSEIIAVDKRLILDLADLNLSTGLDNIEGITFGETLPDGRRSIVLVSDNNFGATAFTQVLAFALDEQPTVLPTLETPTLIDADPTDADADDPAIYVNPLDPEQSIVIGSIKNAGLQVFNLDAEVIQEINPGGIRYNNVDVLYNFQLGGQTIDIAVASDRRNDLLAIFKIDANAVNGQYLVDITSSTVGKVFSTNPVFAPEADEESHTYGVALYKSPVSGKSYVFTSRRNTGDVAQLELVDDGAGGINYNLVRNFTVPSSSNDDLSPQVEGIVVDQETGFLYLGQEDVGIYKYLAEPDGGTTGRLIDTVKDLGGKVLESDVEGLTIYYTDDGAGYLLASSQGNNTFAVYSREGFNDFLGTFTVGINGEIDGVQESDGADISNIALGSKFPLGLFVTQDGSNDPVVRVNDDGQIENVATNFKFIPYENVSATFDLVIDTEGYDPRNPKPNSLLNGVASGDTTQTSTVLFARSNFTGDVKFEYSIEADFAEIIDVDIATVTDPLAPVKVTLVGLNPDTAYYYRVTDAAGAVGTGRFNTSAELGTARGLRFAAAGDWRGELSPYPAISNADDLNLDFFIELGDTVYADFPSRAVDKPQAETLEEFRLKQSEVYGDRFDTNTFADLRASTSILATIDDHEVQNDFEGGTISGEGTLLVNDTELYDNGLQAFQEYNPINDNFYGATGETRTAGERELYRYNTYGSDAAAFVLDARSFRDGGLAPVSNLADPAQVGTFLAASFDSSRTFLGRPQLDDLKRDLLQAQNDGISWKFITVPEPIQNLGVLAASDRFEGYAAERTEILKFVNDNKISNVVFIAADIHGTLVNNLTYQTAPGTAQIATSAFEITTGSVAFDAPFGQTVATIAAQLGLITPAQKAFYDSLPIAGDTDSTINDKDDFIKNLTNTQLASLGYDPLGLNSNLANANGLINATLLQGDYIAAHTFGFTEFDINQATQKLTVTTYGIEAYTEAQLLDNPQEIINRTPEVVSQFEVVAGASTSTTVTPDALITGNTGDNGILALGQNTVFTGAGTDFVAASSNTTGNSRIYGGEGTDNLQASIGDRVFGQGGDDRIDATRGNGGNRLYGVDGNDSLFAGVNDQLFGGNGNDLLYAGLGGSTLSGGAGSDVFLLLESVLPTGTNTITDFQIGVDTLKISGITGETNLTITQQGANTLVGAFGTNLAILTGIQATNISDANFTFG